MKGVGGYGFRYRHAYLHALEKALGAGKFAGDVQFPGLVHGKLGLSDQAHARVLYVDTSEAECLPGVKVVLTARVWLYDLHRAPALPRARGQRRAVRRRRQADAMNEPPAYLCRVLAAQEVVAVLGGGRPDAGVLVNPEVNR